MSDVKLERKEVLSREEAAKQLSALAAALGEAGHVEMELGGVALSVHVPEQVRSELEIEVDGDEVELELELKWSTRSTHGEPSSDAAQGAARGSAPADAGVPTQKEAPR
jgi:amphi-Trp domain-containing protein